MKKKKINIPIMFCFDTNYVIPAAVAFYSLMEHASNKYDYSFYILHSDITLEQQNKLNETVKDFKNCKLEFIDMNHRLDDFWTKNYKGGHFSKEVMYKLLVASIFPNIDKIIVTDVDVVFLGDVSKSYFDLTDDDDAYIAGVKPIGKVSEYLKNYESDWTSEEIKKLGEICGGYLVMNLKKIREDNYETVFLKSLDENGHRLNQMEQDIFNITCYGKIKHLHLKYVACSYMWDFYKNDYDKETDLNYSKKEIEEAMEKPVQLHYATSIKPWKNVDCTLSEVWFKYIVKTPFLKEYLNDLPNKIITKKSEKEKLLLKTKKSIIKFFDEHDDKKIWRYLRLFIRILVIFFKNPTIIFKKYLYRNIKRKLKSKSFSLIIIDDVFPSPLSPFRYEEYYSYFCEFSNVYVATTGSSLPCLKEYRELNEVIKDFENINSRYIGKIFDISSKKREESFKILSKVKNPIAIIAFQKNLINELYDNLSWLEENNIPFILTLYPGGGFKLNEKSPDKNLKRILSSKSFKKVIVTQDITKNYLIKNNLCEKEKIEMVFGVVTPSTSLNASIKNKKYYYKDKKYLDICFVAHKYSKNGIDKGYDLFIESAKQLLKRHKNIKFHVVGDFSKDDVDVKQIIKHIEFHGILNNIDLNKLYGDMDIIISPTRPFKLSSGSFDGFPTGASTEAMLNGVCLITTDELKQNNNRYNNKDIIIVGTNSDEITSAVENLYNNPRQIISIAKSGRKKAKKLYSKKNQIDRRINIIDELGRKMYRK